MDLSNVFASIACESDGSFVAGRIRNPRLASPPVRRWAQIKREEVSANKRFTRPGSKGAQIKFEQYS